MNIRRLIAAAAIIAIVIIPCACSSRKGTDPLYRANIMKAMKSMRPGDWVLYFVNNSLHVRMQVTKRDSKGVTIEYLGYLSLAPRSQSTTFQFDFDEVKHNLKSGLDIYGKMPLGEMKPTKEPVFIADRNVTLESMHWTISTRGPVIEEWFSDEVPLWGLIRQKRNDRYALAIRSWGRAGEKIWWPQDLAPIRSITPPPPKTK